MRTRTFRVPFTGAYNSRTSAVNILTDESGVVGAGVVGVMIVGNSGSTSNKDRRFINCWTESVNDEYNRTRTLYLVKRPGFAELNTPQSGSVGNQILVWTGLGSGTNVITAFGASDSSIYDGTTQLVTDAADTTKITGVASGITETVISNTPTIAITSSDSTAWWYQNAGTVTQITDTDFPGNAGLTLAGTFAHLDGYAFVMDTNGGLWNSDLNSITSWRASSVLNCNSYPDKGIGCIRKGTHIVAFGSQSIQFFRNAGNPFGSPLQRVEEMTLKIGCVGAEAIAQSSDDIYWAGSTPEGGLSIYNMSNGVQRVSTPEIDRILQLSGAANIKLTSCKIYGRTFVIVNASTVTFVYIVEEKNWHEWNSSQGRYWGKCSGVSSGSDQVTYSISTSNTSGKVFVINPSGYSFQDNGTAYTATAQSALMGKGGRRVTWHDIEILADVEGSTSIMTVSVSDDDYETATTLGTVDLSQPRPRINRCGSSYRRAWILTHASATPFRIEAITGRMSEAVF